jgi:hypothetical protein
VNDAELERLLGGTQRGSVSIPIDWLVKDRRPAE